MSPIKGCLVHLKEFFGHKTKIFALSRWQIAAGIISVVFTYFGLQALLRKLTDFGTFIALASVGFMVASVATFGAAALVKAWDWRQMFGAKRPSLRACAAASGLSGIAGLLVPGLLADVVRVEAMHKFEGDTLAESAEALGTSGMLDPAAMAPFALYVACFTNMSSVVRIPLIVYGVLGVVLLGIVFLLPDILKHPKLAKFGLIKKLSTGCPNRKASFKAYLAALAAFLLRSLALLFLLKAVTGAGDFQLMLGMQCIGAVMGIIPIGAAGAAGASIVLLTSAGVPTVTAVSFSVAAQLATVVGSFLFVPGALGVVIWRKLSGKSHKHPGTTGNTK